MRFDVLLSELHLFKSRVQAQSAVAEGRALLNGSPVKSSHATKPGDRITLSEAGSQRTFELLELPRGSVSKKRARELIREIPPTSLERPRGVD
jgi:ribosomal 50S subunit-recycling heat shock protein